MAQFQEEIKYYLAYSVFFLERDAGDSSTWAVLNYPSDRRRWKLLKNHSNITILLWQYSSNSRLQIYCEPLNIFAWFPPVSWLTQVDKESGWWNDPSMEVCRQMQTKRKWSKKLDIQTRFIELRTKQQCLHRYAVKAEEVREWGILWFWRPSCFRTSGWHMKVWEDVLQSSQTLNSQNDGSPWKTS